MRDLDGCGSEVIIECPFVTRRRLDKLMPIFTKLKARKIRIIVNTRDPHEYDEEQRRDDAHRVIAPLQHLGVHVLFTGGHHRKLVILDRNILYEGSLNVLSQNDSTEVMRRIESTRLAWQMIRFIGIDKHT
ncbi:MAG TPA: phospholipase D-like domain-containing protein [Candidatus Saccharimonadales bacterium]|nr:phospholipase D-like domain-containing protein [Candidatus Saccharimonadales bacterium]